MNTLTGWEQAVAAHEDAQDLSRGQQRRLALKISKRAADMQVVDPDDLIRNVIIYADPTGAEAVRNVMAGSA